MKDELKIQTVRAIALALPETTEEPHFEKTSFRVKNKIFVTSAGENLTLKLNPIDQDVFVSIGKGGIYPVPNKWGQQGWTIIELNNIQNAILKDAITTAYCTVAPKKLAAQVRPDQVE